MIEERKYTRGEVMEFIAKGLKWNNVQFGLQDRLYALDYNILGAVNMCFTAEKDEYPSKEIIPDTKAGDSHA